MIFITNIVLYITPTYAMYQMRYLVSLNYLNVAYEKFNIQNKLRYTIYHTIRYVRFLTDEISYFTDKTRHLYMSYLI